jgi:hypothetical protein
MARNRVKFNQGAKTKPQYQKETSDASSPNPNRTTKNTPGGSTGAGSTRNSQTG